MGKCRPLADKEIALMKQSTPDLRDKAVIALEKTGYRANEIASLKVDDVFDFLVAHAEAPRLGQARTHEEEARAPQYSAPPRLATGPCLVAGEAAAEWLSLARHAAVAVAASMRQRS